MNRILMTLAAGGDLVQQGVNQAGGNKDTLTVGGVVTTVISVALWVVGVLAVGFIIYGGVRYAMSGGDSAKTKAARDTILYAVIGLVVAILAYTIVGFVTGAFTGGTGEESSEESDGSGGDSGSRGPSGGNVLLPK